MKFEIVDVMPIYGEELCNVVDVTSIYNPKAQDPEWNLYSKKARLLAEIYNPRWFAGVYYNGTHQIDHRYSIYKGFQQKVPLHVIGNRNNLEPLTIAQNESKCIRCSITLEELYATATGDEQFLRMCRIIDKMTLEELEQYGKVVNKKVISKYRKTLPTTKPNKPKVKQVTIKPVPTPDPWENVIPDDAWAV